MNCIPIIEKCKKQFIYILYNIIYKIKYFFVFLILVLINTASASELCANLFKDQRASKQKPVVYKQEIKNRTQLAKAIVHGLELNPKDKFLWAIYLTNFFEYTPSDLSILTRINKIDEIQKEYKEIFKPSFRSYSLNINLNTLNSKDQQDLMSLFKNLKRLFIQRGLKLIQVEDNIPYWSKLMGRSLNKKDREHNQILKKEIFNFLEEDFIKDLKEKELDQELISKLYKKLNSLLKNTKTKDHFYIVSEAILDLINIFSFNSLISYNTKTNSSLLVTDSLRSFLNFRNELSLSLTSKSFVDLVNDFSPTGRSFYSQKYNEADLLKQLEDFKKKLKQTPTSHGNSKCTIRSLSLKESPFRGYLGGDCSTSNYFEKALDPNFIYWTKTHSNFKSSGQITTVLGTAQNQSGEIKKVAFLDKIQSIPLDEIVPILVAIKQSLEEEGYALIVPKNIEGENSLSNTPEITKYVTRYILKNLTNSFIDFTPHKNNYNFHKGYTRAYDNLYSLEFDLDLPPDSSIRITANKKEDKYFLNKPIQEHFIKNILSLKNLNNETDIKAFINQILELNQLKHKDFSNLAIIKHLNDLLKQHKSLSFNLRKKILYNLMLFDLEKIDQKINTYFNVFEKKELFREIKDWEKSKVHNKKLSFKLLKMYFFLNLANKSKKPLDSSDLPKQLVRLFLKSVERGYLSLLKDFFKNPYILENLKLKNYSFKETALHLSVINNHISIADYLLKQGANIHSIYNQKSILEVAIDKNNLEMIKFLIEAGADIHIKNRSQNTALHLAVKEEDLEIIDFFINQGLDLNAGDKFQNTALHFATEIKNSAIVQLLLSKGANIHVINSFDETALELAIEKNQLKIVQLLINAGADIHIKNRFQNTALHIAVLNKNLKMIRFFIKQKIDLNSKNRDGNTALHLAIEENQSKIAQLLINAGADVYSIDGFQTPALHIAVLNENLKMIRFFIKQKIDLNSKNRDGNTALHLAIEENQSKIAQLLINAGADIYSIDEDQNSALHIAVLNKNLKMIRFFIKQKIDLNSKDKDGSTALDLALDMGDKEMIKLISESIKITK